MNSPYDKTIVRSLEKGLAVIEALNVQDGLSIHEIAAATGINRAIVYRLVETLRRRGYVSKGPDSQRYWLEPMVQALASGYKNEAWIHEVVQPICQSLGQSLTWPVNFTTYTRQGMVVRACSDYESPMTVEKIPIGYCIPVYSSSTGRVHLAFCTDRERVHIMDMLFPVETSASGGNEQEIGAPLLRDYDKSRRRDRAYFDEDRLAAVRRRGYDEVFYTPPGLPHRVAISAPVFDEDRLVGVLSVRCYTVAVSAPGALDACVKSLLAAARRVGERLARRTQVAPA